MAGSPLSGAWKHGTTSLLGEAIIAALLALGVFASLRTGKTFAFGEWRIPYLARRSKDPFDFWSMVILLGVGASYLAIRVAIHDAAALVAPTIGAGALAWGVAVVPKFGWEGIAEIFIGPPAKPAVKTEARHTRASVAVRGWDHDELQRIIADFSTKYDLPKSSIELETQIDGVSTVTVSDEVAPETVCFLVNYFNYPNGYDLSHRSIGVLARATLPHGFGTPALIGKAALIYVPSADAEYDQVYVQCAEKYYIVPLTNFHWQVTADPRRPATISDL